MIDDDKFWTLKWLIGKKTGGEIIGKEMSPMHHNSDPSKL